MSKRVARRVLLIGWDAADWRVINPMLDRGEMPALESMINGGVMGNLASLDPPMSPMLWTSIATGKTADQHGILGFTQPDPESGTLRPVMTTSRKCKAVWNILMQTGLKVNVVGWWPSHPAEPVNGAYVSNFYHHPHQDPRTPWTLPRNCIHPAELEDVLGGLRVHPAELSGAHLAPFVPAFADIDQEKDPRIGMLAKTIAEASTVHAAATWIMEHTQWDFMAVYYDAIDHFCHGFMQFHPPRMDHVPEKLFELYHNVVTAGYRFHDMMLARLLQLAGPETTVIIVSDHGFHPDHLRPVFLPQEPAGPAWDHRPYGIFCMRGPHVRRDESLFGASLLDVTPTILHLYGLPVAQDMRGKPLAQTLDENSTPEVISTWEGLDDDCGMLPATQQVDPLAEQAAMDQLIALGYVSPPDENRQKAIERSVRESRFYLARVYLTTRRPQLARPIFEELYRSSPDTLRFGLRLVQCYEALHQPAEGLKVLDDIMAKAKETTPGLHYLKGCLYLAAGQAPQALECLKKAQESKALASGLYTSIGFAYLRLEQWNAARSAFEKELDIDADNAGAYLGLGMAIMQQGDAMAAADCFLNSIGLQYFNPDAHLRLGKALISLNRFQRAEEALRVCTVQAPDMTEPHRLLLHLYEGHLKNPDQARQHRSMLEQLETGAVQHRDVPDESVIHTQVSPATATAPRAVAPIDTASDIVVVSGLPRSGTSMMMKMLADGGMPIMQDGKRKADNDNPLGYFEYEKVKNLHCDTSWIGNARGRALKVIAQLLPFLPPDHHYRILFMVRDIQEIVLSQQKMLERMQKNHTQHPADLTATFHKQLDRIMSWLEGQQHLSVFYVPYHDVISQPSVFARRVNRFLGGSLDEQNMAGAIDPKLYRQRLAHNHSTASTLHVSRDTNLETK